jgi:signal peptidase II
MQLFNRPRGVGLACAALALALDQGHKLFMLYALDIGAREPIRIFPFLDVTLSWNYGVSYSMFAAHDGWARAGLLAFQLAVVAGLCVWLWRAQGAATAAALGAIVGGALGNAVDRLTHGAVADFFYLHTTLPVGPLANYVFNIADVAITVGVALLLYESLFPPPAPSETPS